MDKLRNEGNMQPVGKAAFALHLEAESGVYAHEQNNIPELDVPDRERFESDPAAWAYFQAAPLGYRKTILHWITKAKREETRRAAGATSAGVRNGQATNLISAQCSRCSRGG